MQPKGAPMKKKTIIITASVIVVLILGIVVVRQRLRNDGPHETAVVVRLNAPFPAIDFAPFYVAKTKGWLDASLAGVGAKPDYVGSFGEIALSNESLAADRIDMLL